MQKSIAQNTSYFTAALIIQKILSFFYFWYISSRLATANFGEYTYALSFAGIVAVFIELGLTVVFVREAAKDVDKTEKYLRNVLGLKLVFSIMAIGIAVLIINLLGDRAEVIKLVYLALAIKLVNEFTVTLWGAFRVKQNLFYESVAAVFIQVIIIVGGIGLWKATGEVKMLMLALLIAGIVELGYSAALVKFKLKLSLLPAWERSPITRILKVIPFFAAAGIFVTVYNYIDSILLKKLASSEAVAFFAVPIKVVTGLQQVIPYAFASAIFPVFSSNFKTSKEQLSQTFFRAFSYIIIISLPITVGLIMLAPQIIGVVWPKYIAVVPTFRIVAAAVPFLFLAFPTGYLLNACDRQKNTTINRGIMTATAIILNIILIPSYSYLGAGVTFLVANIIVLVLDWHFVKKIVTVNSAGLTKIISKALLATLLMASAIYIFQPMLQLLIIVPLAVLVYFGGLLLLKGVSISEARKIFKAMR